MTRRRPSSSVTAIITAVFTLNKMPLDSKHYSVIRTVFKIFLSDFVVSLLSKKCCLCSGFEWGIYNPVANNLALLRQKGVHTLFSNLWKCFFKLCLDTRFRLYIHTF